GIKDKILFTRSSSPLTIERIAGSSEGSIVGWTFENPLPIDAGMLNMKKAVLTPFDDIYKAGQWTVSPAGLPTCIMTAKMVADRIKKER
ncbi:MAG: NAD(P)/FAD-dependent oxidoreductase, partial [Sphaerochaetaceae bacterium]|nr:NAD(P)/FAD-dependent oxidoreductase [Sphaerochaetaceae bacterium]